MPEWLSLIDVAVAVIIFLFAWGGSQKGFAAQMSHVITFIIFAILLFFGYPFATEFFSRIFRNLHELYLTWLLVAACIALTVLAFRLVSRLLAHIMKPEDSEASDKVGGFFFGAIRGVLTVLLAMTLMVILGTERLYQTFNAKSRVGQLVCRELVPRVHPHVNRGVVGEKVDRVRNKMLQREEAGKLEE